MTLVKGSGDPPKMGVISCKTTHEFVWISLTETPLYVPGKVSKSLTTSFNPE